jgi:putative Mn2+ efflux pump MntP
LISLICAALLLSIDSVLVSFALGTCRLERRQTDRLAAAFGLLDGAASLIGLLLGFSLSSKLVLFGHWAGPALVGAYAVIMLMLARRGRSMADSGSLRGIQMLYVFPLVLCLDNLAASFALVHAASPLASAAVIGIVSGLGSLCGFRVGELAVTTAHWFRGVLGIQREGLYNDGLVLLSAAVLIAIG